MKRQLEKEEKRRFWMDAYLADIRAGGSPEGAKSRADMALSFMCARFDIDKKDA